MYSQCHVPSKTSLNFCNEIPYTHPPNALILFFDYISTNAHNSLNLSNHSHLGFITSNHTFHENLSTKITKYLARQQTYSTWGHKHPNAQSLRVLLVISPHRRPTLPYIAYPSVHSLQTNVEVDQEVSPRFMTLTVL